MRLCVIGDELAAGIGDPRGFGWVGRVLAYSEFSELLILMTLASSGETMKDLCARWEGEVMSRPSSGGPRGLLVHIGANDISVGLSSACPRLNLVNITGRAMALGILCFVIGSAPLVGVDHHSVKEPSRSCTEVCQRWGLFYVDSATPLATHDQWFEDMAASRVQSASGLTSSGQSGYALIARLILHLGRYEWAGVEPQD